MTDIGCILEFVAHGGKRRKIFVVGRKKENMIARGNVFPRAMRYAWKTKI